MINIFFHGNILPDGRGVCETAKKNKRKRILLAKAYDLKKGYALIFFGLFYYPNNLTFNVN